MAICNVNDFARASSAEMTPRKSPAAVEFYRIGLLDPRNDLQLVVIEQQAEVGFERGTLDRNLHLERERTVPVLVVDRDRSDLALAHRDLGAIDVAAVRHDPERLVAEGALQVGLQAV